MSVRCSKECPMYGEPYVNPGQYFYYPRLSLSLRIKVTSTDFRIREGLNIILKSRVPHLIYLLHSRILKALCMQFIILTTPYQLPTTHLWAVIVSVVIISVAPPIITRSFVIWVPPPASGFTLIPVIPVYDGTVPSTTLCSTHSARENNFHLLWSKSHFIHLEHMVENTTPQDIQIV